MQWLAGARAGLAAAAVYVCIAVAVAPAVAQDVRDIPGSRVRIAVPATYTPADRFTGFLDTTSGTSIIVLDVPGERYEQMAAGMTVDGLAATGLKEIAVGTLEGRALPHILITAEQATAGGVFAKFVMLVRSAEHGALVTVNVPKTKLAVAGTRRSDIEALLRTVSFTRDPAPRKALFSFTYLGPFRSSDGVPGGASVYTLDGAGPPVGPEPGRVLFLVVPSLSTGRVDIGRAAESAIAGVAGTTNVTMTKKTAVTIDGLKGIAHQATALSRTTDGAAAPIVLYQVMLADPKGGYVRMLGQAPAARAREFVPEFEKIARSFSLAN